MTTFAFPTLLSNFITALNGASSLTDTRIFDGAEIDSSFPNDWVAVGYDGGDGENQMLVASALNEHMAFGEIHSEDGYLTCVLTAQDGGSTLTQLRVRAYNLLSAVDSVIRSDPKFSNAVLDSWLESHTTFYRATNLGFAVVINFTLAYKAST